MTIYRKEIAAKYLNQILKNTDPAITASTHQYALFPVGSLTNLMAGTYTDELSGGGYARVTGKNIFPLASSTDQAVANTQKLTFPTPTANWVKAKYLAIFNNTGTTLLYVTEIKNAPTAKTGEPIIFEIGTILWYLDQKVIPVANVNVSTFTSNSSWTAPSNITSATVLIVAGGGGGIRGGGGAGGVLSNVDITNSVVAGQTYTITVGSGGSGGAYNGANSSAFGYTAVGGGHGGSSSTMAADGGSGGGGSEVSYPSPQYQGGDGIAGQGYNGGNATAGAIDYPYTGAGGGGAGGPGGSPNDDGTYVSGGAGGVGIFSDISGTNTYYAHGGQGGNSYNDPPSPTSEWYGAGGNGAGNGAGTAGQSGVVIIRYTTA